MDSSDFYKFLGFYGNDEVLDNIFGLDFFSALGLVGNIPNKNITNAYQACSSNYYVNNNWDISTLSHSVVCTWLQYKNTKSTYLNLFDNDFYELFPGDKKYFLSHFYFESLLDGQYKITHPVKPGIGLTLSPILIDQPQNLSCELAYHQKNFYDSTFQWVMEYYPKFSLNYQLKLYSFGSSFYFTNYQYLDFFPRHVGFPYIPQQYESSNQMYYTDYYLFLDSTCNKLYLHEGLDDKAVWLDKVIDLEFSSDPAQNNYGFDIRESKLYIWNAFDTSTVTGYDSSNHIKYNINAYKVDLNQPHIQEWLESINI